jgi:putative flippase GtrA
VIGQLTRFCVVGASNTLVTLVSFWVLQRAGVPYLPASAIAFAAGAVNGLKLNGAWTFGRRGRLVPYAAVQLVGLALDAVLMALVAGQLHAPHLAAQIAVLPPVTLTTFALNRSLVFAAAPPSLARRWVASSRPSPPGSRA